MRKSIIAARLVMSFLASAGLLLNVQISLGQKESPALSGNADIRLAGLRQAVTIRRDGRGIPHIQADNELDLFLAQGYVTASDRLWQMDLLRRTARGELSEVFGSTTLEEDKRRRVYDFAAIAKEQVKTLPSPVRAVYEEYARGVNAYIDSLDPKSLPVEFQLLLYSPRHWTPEDSLVIGKLLAESLSSTWRGDIINAALTDLPESTRRELTSQVSPWDVLLMGSDNVNRATAGLTSRGADSNRLAITTDILHPLFSIEEMTTRSLRRTGLYAPGGAASNNWVLSGKHSSSGKPLLANDPHLEASAPSIWYMTHLSGPRLHAAGVTLPGVPCILIGHNDQIAWGATNLESDVQDVYGEKFDAQNPRLYKTPQGWREAAIRHETINVRKSFKDMASEAIPFDIVVTRHGPVVLEKDSNHYALRWTILDARFLDLPAFYAINRARNWKEFCAALSTYSGPAQNFVYADKEGHIGYYGAGKVPIRRSGDGTLPYDGSTDSGEWTGFIPFDKLPHVYDPPSGIIVTANNRIVGESYSYFLTRYWVPPYRARRILDLLQSSPRLSVDDFSKIQGDTYSISASHFARNVLEIAGKVDPGPSDAGWGETIRLLSGWDGRLNAESRVAPLVLYFRDAFRFRIARSVMGDDRASRYHKWINDTSIDRIITDRTASWLPREFKNYLEFLKACNKDARQALTKRFGSDESQWVWGRLAQVRFTHPLASFPLIGQRFTIPPFPQNGSAQSLPTINAGSSVSMRFIADLSDWDRAQMGIALGQSGDTSSPHWADQLPDWRAAKPGVFPFTKGVVASATTQTILLSPNK
jgi:penicillin amidase